MFWRIANEITLACVTAPDILEAVMTERLPVEMWEDSMKCVVETRVSCGGRVVVIMNEILTKFLWDI